MSLVAPSKYRARAATPRGDSSRIYGSGEMADLVRGFDWASTPVGPISQWPETLLTTVNLLLATRHPLFLWWGEDLIQFYNDAYRPSLGKSKHPGALGQRGSECWAEVWDTIGPQIASVMRGGEATWNEDQYLPVYRNGKDLEDAYWTYSYSPLRDNSGEIRGVFVVVTETTERLMAQRRLQGSEERLQFALESAELGMWFYDDNTKIAVGDAAMQRIFGSPRASGDYNYWIQFVHPDDREHVGAEFTASIAHNAPYESEYRIVSPEGETRWIRSKGRLRDDPENRMVVIVEDITERKVAEMELQESTRDLREAQRIGRMGSWRLALSTNELTWSEEVYRLTGQDPSLPVLNYAKQPEIMEPDSLRRLEAAVGECIATGRPYELDTKMYLPGNGKTVWFATRGEALLDADGRVTELRGTVRDITDRKLTEEALRRSEEQLQLAIESANLGTWTYDSATGMTTGDAAMQRIFGASQASGDYEYWISFAHPDDRKSIEEDFRAAIAGDAPYETEYRIVRPTDGEERWIRSQGRVLREADQSLRMLVVVEDITDRKRTQAALLRNEKLAAVGRLASSIAHEINNPLESVTNLLYLARTAGDGQQIVEYLDIAETELRRASAITSTTLRFHRQATRPAEVACDDLIAGVLGIHQSRMNNKGVSVERRMRSRRPLVCSDGEVRQVLSNLIGNAIDAMQSSGGRLLVRSRETQDWGTGRAGVAITVADTGPGIPAATVNRIFEAFYTTKGDAGTGLGLWISKEIVDRHEGRLTVRSSQRRGHSGSVFTLFLPHQAATP